MSLQANKRVHLTLNHTRPPGRISHHQGGCCTGKHLLQRTEAPTWRPDLSSRGACSLLGRIQDVVQGSNIPRVSSGGGG